MHALMFIRRKQKRKNEEKKGKYGKRREKRIKEGKRTNRDGMVQEFGYTFVDRQAAGRQGL